MAPEESGRAREPTSNRTDVPSENRSATRERGSVSIQSPMRMRVTRREVYCRRSFRDVRDALGRAVELFDDGHLLAWQRRRRAPIGEPPGPAHQDQHRDCRGGDCRKKETPPHGPTTNGCLPLCMDRRPHARCPRGRAPARGCRQGAAAGSCRRPNREHPTRGGRS